MTSHLIIGIVPKTPTTKPKYDNLLKCVDLAGKGRTEPNIYNLSISVLRARAQPGDFMTSHLIIGIVPKTPTTKPKYDNLLKCVDLPGKARTEPNIYNLSISVLRARAQPGIL